VAMAAERCQVRLTQKRDSGWQFPKKVAECFDWPNDKFQVEVFNGDDLYFEMLYEDNSIY
jgi:hypothetical protein